MAKLQKKLAANTIVIFDKDYLKVINMSLLFEVSLATWIAYFSNFVARST